MKIFLWSETYLPNLGGIETVAQALAEEFTRQGHDVRLLTWTKADPKFDKYSPFTIIRLPNRKIMFETARWCDVCLHNGIMQAGLGPLIYYLLPLRKPWILLHQFFLSQVKIRTKPKIYYSLVESFIAHVYLCHEMQAFARKPGTVLGNPYRDSVFKKLESTFKDRHVVYLGRLVSYKGVNILIDAISKLKEKGKYYYTTIIGGGPEQQNLEQQVQLSGLQNQVQFTGILRGHEIASILNNHQVIVIPSMWREPFGVVALEGIACGCIPIGSRTGGLIDAIGSCGLTFPRGDSSELANLIENVLEDANLQQRFRINAQDHLEQYTARSLVRRYLELFESLI
jgi:glycosyltransferase involved in cell wall biosynthesis